MIAARHTRSSCLQEPKERNRWERPRTRWRSFAPYHRGWSSKAFDDAVRLLSPDLKVETPINEYATESFVNAVFGCGGAHHYYFARSAYS